MMSHLRLVAKAIRQTEFIMAFSYKGYNIVITMNINLAKLSKRLVYIFFLHRDKLKQECRLKIVQNPFSTNWKT